MLRRSIVRSFDSFPRSYIPSNARLLSCKQYRQRRYFQTARLLSDQTGDVREWPQQSSQSNQKSNWHREDKITQKNQEQQKGEGHGNEKSETVETKPSYSDPDSANPELKESASVQSHFEKLLQVDDPIIQSTDAENETGICVRTESEEDSVPSAPPRVIYFDTQKVYTTLKYSGYSGDQADMLMQTLRDTLYMAMSDCRENAVQLSTVQNEAYLFEAACSELRNEIQTDRTAQAESYRVNLARLSRDVEILRHEIEETINTMKSEIDMEVNERKNVTRGEESQVEMRIQELNNKITIDINSEIKSEIEALRWQTTRRGLVAIVVVVCSILIATSATKKEEKRLQRRVGPILVGEEYQVPILNTSEYDEIEDRPVEVLS
jgi:Protein of unknown function (DUF1640)